MSQTLSCTVILKSISFASSLQALLTPLNPMLFVSLTNHSMAFISPPGLV
jgi:hypothetical protein